MEWISDYSLFFLKVLTIVIALMVIILFIALQKKKKSKSGTLDILDLTEEYAELTKRLNSGLMSKEQLKKWLKDEKIKQKEQLKQQKQSDKAANNALTKPTLYVLSFSAGINPHEVENLRKEITAILAVAKPKDEVLLRLESGGGVVHGYGLAAAQLQRITAKSISLTVAIDKVAASGGYMMACVAQQIVAAPFAIVGSIGVVAQLPNINKLLKKNDIDIELHTAGQYKRTLTVLGENTEEGRQKFQSELNATHLLFKQFIQQNRPGLNLEEVATGEYWFGTQALEKQLVDKISTSDEVILDKMTTHRVITLGYSKPKSLLDRIIGQTALQLECSLLKWLKHFTTPHL